MKSIFVSLIVVSVILVSSIVLLVESNKILPKYKQEQIRNSESEVINIVKEYLENKYEEEFGIDTIQSNSTLYGSDGYIGTAYYLNLDNKKFFEFYIDKNNIIKNNFYYVLIEDEIKDNILENIKKIDKKMVIKTFSFSTKYADDRLNKETTLEQALSQQLLELKINIITDTKIDNNKLKQIEDILFSMNYNGRLSIICFGKEEYNKIVKDDEWMNYYNKRIKDYTYYVEVGNIKELKEK